jgi:ParB family chromosome partitioning protein
MASRKAGITEVPALVVSLDRDAAAIVLVDSNLHREHILPSEKAFAYKMKAEALAHKGFRADLTSEQLAPKLSTEQIADDEVDFPELVRTKRFEMKPMPIEEAIDQMDLVGHDFYLFRNVEDGNELNVLYRRRDGTYGILASVPL